MNDKLKNLPRSTGKRVSFLSPHSLETCRELLAGITQVDSLFSKYVVTFYESDKPYSFKVRQVVSNFRSDIYGNLEAQPNGETLVHLEKRTQNLSLIIIQMVVVSILILIVLSSSDNDLNLTGNPIVLFLMIVLLGGGFLFSFYQPKQLLAKIEALLASPVE
jgi:hypothetical protein